MKHIVLRRLYVLLLANWIWVLGLGIVVLAGMQTRTAVAQNDPLCFPANSNPKYGSIPLSTQQLTIIEDSVSATYTIKLCSEPHSEVDVILRPDTDWSSHITIKPSLKIHFEPASWDKPITITLEAIDDDFYTGSNKFYITHRAQSEDSDYDDFESSDPDTNFPRIRVNYQDNEQGMFLPLVAKEPNRTWQKLMNISGDIDVIAIANNKFFAGNRDSDAANNGLHSATLDNSKCQNNNLTFTKQIANLKVSGLAFSGQNSLLSSNGNGVYRSTTGGSQWSQVTDVNDPYAFAVIFANENLVYLGGDTGVFQSTNGQAWQKVIPFQDGPTLINEFSYDESTNQLWIATYGDGVWSLTAGDTKFSKHNGGLNDPNGNLRVWDVAFQSSSRLYIATTSGIYSGNGINEWQSFGLQQFQILTLSIQNNIIYAGTRDNGLWYQVIGNTSWQQVPKFQNESVRDILFDQTGLCNDPITNRNALLAATTDGIWIYR